MGCLGEIHKSQFWLCFVRRGVSPRYETFSIFSIFKQLKFLHNDKYFSLLIFPDPAWVRQADVAYSQPHLWLHISTRHVPRDSIQAIHVTNSLQVVMKEFLILVQTQFYTFYVQLLNIYRFYHPILKSQSCIKTL